MADPVPSADRSSLETKEVGLAKAIAGARDKPAVKAASEAAKLGDQEPLYAFAGLLTVVGVAFGRPRMIRAGIRVAAAVAVADLLKSMVKDSVARSRPRTVIEEGRYVSESSDGGHGKPEQSFPSGHVACSVAAGVALSRVEPRIAPVAALAVTGLGVTRVLEGAHWPSDVAAGLVVGLVAEGATALVAWPIERLLKLSGPRRRE